jgi:kynureninase
MPHSYFLYHSIGIYPGKAADLVAAMLEFADIWARPNDAQWAYVLGKRADFLTRWRAILNASPQTVTATENVTAAFHALLAALPQANLKGRKVLVGADCFPSNHFLLSGMAEKYGFTLQTVPLRQGAAYVEDDDFIDAWTPETGLALLTWVSSTSSHRINLDRLTKHGRQMGSLIGTDITQAAGLIPYDVQVPKVDFTISTSLKWMCGTPGAGVLYLAPHLLPQCKPELRGWFSQENPFNWDITNFQYAPDIRRFDNGTPGSMAAVASLPALNWHAAQDQTALLAHNRALTAQLIEAADDLNLPLITPRSPDKRGGSIMLRLSETHSAAELVNTLRTKGIHTDARGQTLRLSPGIQTTSAGTETLIHALKTTLRP